MGKSDALTKAYMSKADVFADAFNCLIYDGEPIIQPEQLHEMDPTAIAALYGDNKQTVHTQVYRDVLKYVTAKEDGHFAYLILGIENQSAVHYAMPVRNMLYDALQYNAQIREKAKTGKHKTPEEFLSGFGKTDKLLPVITLVVYFGSKPWDAPKSLSEMFALEDKRALAYVQDYKINLLEPAKMTDEAIAGMTSELRQVFYFIKYSGNKDRLQTLVTEDAGFRKLKRDTAELLNTVTGSTLKVQEGEEEIDMCKALQDMRDESHAKGHAEGRIEERSDILSKIQSMDLPKDVIDKIMQQLGNNAAVSAKFHA